jgi:hypothetical protein
MAFKFRVENVYFAFHGLAKVYGRIIGLAQAYLEKLFR